MYISPQFEKKNFKYSKTHLRWAKVLKWLFSPQPLSFLFALYLWGHGGTWGKRVLIPNNTVRKVLSSKESGRGVDGGTVKRREKQWDKMGQQMTTVENWLVGTNGFMILFSLFYVWNISRENQYKWKAGEVNFILGAGTNALDVWCSWLPSFAMCPQDKASKIFKFI